MNTLLIGNNDGLVTDDFQVLGISHLFVISGLHMGLIIGFLRFFLKKIKLKDQTIEVVALAFGLVYLVLTNFMISLIRVVVGLALKLLFKKISALDRLSLGAMILLIINPYYICQLSFILTYVASFFIICFNLGKEFIKFDFI